MPETTRVFKFESPDPKHRGRIIFVEVSEDGIFVGHGSEHYRDAVQFSESEALLVRSAIREAVDFARARGGLS